MNTQAASILFVVSNAVNTGVQVSFKDSWYLDF